MTRKNAQNQYKRSNSLYYSLALLVSKELICKIMFLRTLGLKTDGVIAEFVRRKETSEMETLIKDNRGKAVPKAKLDKDLIWKHIMPYHLQINHRKSQNAPNKRYLEPHLTITAIWEDYKPTNGHISYIVYLQVFQSENIRFYESSPDERDVNAKYRTHSKDLNGAHDRDACEICKVCQDHKKKAEEARTHHRKDRDKDADNTGIYTVLMQKIILLPKMSPKNHFFVCLQ